MKNKDDIGYVYVLGLPYISGRISVDSEEYITNVRLLSISCSASKRPFFQEGYLVQTEFAYDTEIDKGELDFNRRIVAIYKFKNDSSFWGDETPINEAYLYPANDIMKEICDSIRNKSYNFNNTTANGDLIFEFLTLWNVLEKEVRYKTESSNFWKGINKLSNINGLLCEQNKSEIDSLRRFRNEFVHNVNSVSDEQIQKGVDKLKRLMTNLEIKF